MYRIRPPLALCFACLPWCVAAAEPARPDSRDTPFPIDCQEAGTLTAKVEGARAIFSIKGGRGIGRATVRRNLERWPPTVVVRAYLGGLESLTIAAGDVRLSASVLSHSGHPTLLHLWNDGKEGPQLKNDSPYWIEIRRLDAEGQPVKVLPPKGGWFEVTIPRKLLADTREFELRWIDFYR